MKSAKQSPKYLAQHRGSRVSFKEDLKKRRTSSRPIRRKKFDDELVESSLSKSQKYKPSNILSPSAPSQVPAISVPSTSSTRTFMETQLEAGKKKVKIGPKKIKISKHFIHDVQKKATTWSPSDDLALILSVVQSNDLVCVYQGVKFSCKFSLKELEDRWKALLYDAATAKAAQLSIRHLPPEEAQQIRRKALFSEEEEQLIASVSKYDGSITDFKTLLNQNRTKFLVGRTPETLREYWSYMKRYNLLADQTAQLNKDIIMTFSDAEDIMDNDDDEELQKVTDKELQEETAAHNLAQLQKIKVLENEVSKWDALVENNTTSDGSSGEALDASTIASLKGRCVNYLMQSQEVTFGRSDGIVTVDIDLALEGPATRISRRQGVIRMDTSGNFYVINRGKKPIYVDGRPLITGDKHRLWNNAVLEIEGLSLTFHTNLEGILHLKKNFNKS